MNNGIWRGRARYGAAAAPRLSVRFVLAIRRFPSVLNCRYAGFTRVASRRAEMKQENMPRRPEGEENGEGRRSRIPLAAGESIMSLFARRSS